MSGSPGWCSQELQADQRLRLRERPEWLAVRPRFSSVAIPPFLLLRRMFSQVAGAAEFVPNAEVRWCSPDR
jgi:hypothetical protein